MTGIRAICVCALVLIGLSWMNACVRLGFDYASLEIDNKPPAKPVLEIASQADWEGREKPSLQQALEDHLYGPVPDTLPTELLSSRIVDPSFRGGLGILEEYEIALGEGSERLIFHLALARPKQADHPVALIINQSFCDNRSSFEHSGLTVSDTARDCSLLARRGLIPSAIKYIFGAFIGQVPVEKYLSRGYAYANYAAGDIAPDAEAKARPYLEKFPIDAKGKRADGVLAAWAAGYFASLDVVEGDPRFDPARMAIMGHSRHGKSALIAAAWDSRIKLVLAHQSGTGGASLSRDNPGESLKQIIHSYPHWFTPEARLYADHEERLPFDQHALLALIAPRQLFLGNARRDVWSDPNGTYRAALAANPVWQQVYERQGLDQAGMADYQPSGDISFFLRPGGHGITRADMEAFLAFLDTRFM